jgi:transketolase C-terminal domain/subunit
MEEHNVIGGLGSAVAEFLSSMDEPIPLLRLGVPDKFIYEAGSRQEIRERCGLGNNQMLAKIRQRYDETVSRT